MKQDELLIELRHWLLVDPLTLDQAATLAVGASPTFARPRPGSFSPMLEAMKQAIKRKDIPAVTAINGMEGKPFSLDDTDQTTVLQADIRAWLAKNKMADAFFYLFPPEYWPVTDAWKAWAKKDLWSTAEFAEICIGRVPGTPNRTDADQIAINQATETIARGTHSQALQFVPRDDADLASRMYGTNRHYRPAIAAEWATERVDTFPSALRDAIKATQPPGTVTEHDRPLATRTRNTLLAIIGALADADTKVDFSQPYKAGEQIEAMLAAKGITLHSRTIGDHLKDVQAAMDTRKS